jgi:hypothetical protein
MLNEKASFIFWGGDLNDGARGADVLRKYFQYKLSGDDGG